MNSDLSSLIQAVERGEVSAAEPLFAALYAELHRMAKRELARQGPAASLGVTTLLHEAYLDMAQRNENAPAFPDRARFMSYACRVMRGLIIDHARERRAHKRGGQFEITSSVEAAEKVADDRELSRLSEALDELAKVDDRKAKVIELRYFGGMQREEIAAAEKDPNHKLHISEPKVRLPEAKPKKGRT